MKAILTTALFLLTNHIQAQTTGQVFERQQVITRTVNGQTTSDQLNYVSLFFETSKENNGFQLVGMVDQFEKISLETNDAVRGQRMRQLLLRRIIGNKTFELGVLGASTTLGGRTNGSEAVVNGGRAIIKYGKGELIVTVGSMAPLRAGQSPLSGEQSSYIEVKVSRQILNDLKLEGSLESVREKRYVRGVGMLDLHLTSEKLITIVADVLVDADTGRAMSSAGIRFDPFKVFFNRDSRVDVSLGFVHASSGFEASRLGLLVPTNMTSNSYINFNLNFAINKKKTGFIFLAASYAPKTQESFLGLGLSLKF